MMQPEPCINLHPCLLLPGIKSPYTYIFHPPVSMNASLCPEDQCNVHHQKPISYVTKSQRHTLSKPPGFDDGTRSSKLTSQPDQQRLRHDAQSPTAYFLHPPTPDTLVHNVAHECVVCLSAQVIQQTGIEDCPGAVEF
jgi:hypothetical protein